MSIVYLDEELPIIDFQTVISDEDIEQEFDIKDKKIGLNIYSSEDIYNQVFLLLQFLKEEIQIPLTQKTKVFKELIEEITTEKKYKIPRNVVPKVYTKRKINKEKTKSDIIEIIEKEKDYEDLETFLNNYYNSIKIDNYSIRREELLKTFQGYTVTDSSAPRLDNINFATRVIKIETEEPQLDNINSATRVIKIEPEEPHIIIPQDNLHPTIDSLNITKGISSYDNSFKKLSMIDKLIEKLDKTYTTVNIPKEEINLKQTIKEAIYQTADVNKYIEELKDIGSLYDLWKDFMKIGINIEEEDLDKDVLTKLEEKLYDLYKKEKEVFVFLKATSNYKQIPIELNEQGGILFYEIQKEIFNKLEPIIEKLQSDLIEIYQTYVDSNNTTSQQNITSLPYNAYDIVMSITDNKVTLSEAIEILKLRLLKEHRNRIETWLKNVKKWDVVKISSKVNKEYDKYQRTKFSFINEEIYSWNIQDEIKKIKKGEILGYNKDNGIQTADSLFTRTEDIMLETDDPDDIDIPVYDDNLPIDIKELDEGKREIFEIVLRMFMSLSKISGLPLDYNNLYANIPQQLRKTKITQIKEQIPDLSDELYNILGKENILLIDTDSLSEIILPGKFQEIKRTIKLIEDEYIKDIEKQLYYLLSWWIYDIQTHVLSRTLQFKLWNGSQEHIDFWSPYGYPMEKNKNIKEGVIPYIQHIIESLINTDGTVWNMYLKGTSLTKIHEELITVLSSTYFSEKVNYLQEKFKNFEKELPNKDLLEKGEKIVKEVDKTIKNQEKSKYLKEYMNFLNNLPSVLIQSSIAKKIHIGCCLQLLSDKYRSDKDYWLRLNRNIYKLKTAFIADKYKKDKVPILLSIIKPTVEEEEKEKLVYIERENIKTDLYLWNLNDILPEIEEYIPVNDYNKLSTTGIQEIINITNKNLNIYNKNIRDNTVIDFVNKTDDLQYLIDFFRKIIGLQSSIIKDKYKDKQDELNYLLSNFEKLYKLFDIILDNKSYLNDLKNIQKIRLVQYIISRQLCFPAKPELARNDNLIIRENNLESTLLNDFIMYQYNYLKDWIIEKTFNQTVNFTEYISKKREEDNIRKLNIVNVMNPEERRLYVSTKKLGLSELEDYNYKFEQKLIEQEYLREAADDYEEAGEEETYPRGENDDQMDMDSLNDEYDY